MLIFGFAFLIYFVSAAKVCCPEMGCITDDSPYSEMPLPWCIDQIRPSYTMYTRTNRDAGQRFTHNSIIPRAFNASLRTVFTIHGFLSRGGVRWMEEMKDAFLVREDINVVVVGWEGGASVDDYFQAAANTRSMGAYTALVINNLVNHSSASGGRIWCVGHSLGAHVCGRTGVASKLQRITGMDPAGLWFGSQPNDVVGLNPSCAQFVDVIHTDDLYGMVRALGHIDFYPAGGRNQPMPDGVADIASYSHALAHDYMIESIKSDCFNSWSRCEDFNKLPGSCHDCTRGGGPCAVMGYGADTGSHRDGLHYIDVLAIPPYCTG